MKGKTMFSKKTIVIAVVATLPVSAFCYWMSFLSSELAIQEQYHPDVPIRIIAIAHRAMFKDTLLGRNEFPADAPDSVIDEYFTKNYLNPLLGI